MIYDRIMTGQIIGITLKEGLRCSCMVRLVEKPEDVTIELSYPFVSISSGIRFVPRVGDKVLVGWTPNLVPYIIGFLLGDIEDKFDKVDLLFLKELNQGDIVLYSGLGETEVLLSSKGYLNLGSGVSLIRLDSLRRVIDFISSFIRSRTLNGVDMRYGRVVRDIDGQEVSIPNMVEFFVGVEKQTGEAVELKIGDVVDKLGVSDVSKLFSLNVQVANVPISEIYIEKTGAINLYNNNFIRLGGVIAVHPIIKGDVLVGLLESIFSTIDDIFSCFKVNEGMEAVLTMNKIKLNSLVGSLSTSLSNSVMVKD